MNIYPYVYKLVHKTTGQFYFGFRCANKVPAEQDIGHHYFSSSKVIKQIGFENFDCYIIAEFFDRVNALALECELIEESWSDPLLLNLSFNRGGTFSLTKHSDEAKAKIAAALIGKKHTPERIAKNGSQKGKTFTNEQRAHLSIVSKGVPKSPEHRAAIGAAMTGKKRPPGPAAWREAARIANTGSTRSEETKAKMRAAWERRRQTALTS